MLDQDGSDGFEAARARSGLSLLYAMMGRYAVAESVGRRAVAVLERSGTARDAMAEAYFSLAEVYRRSGNLGRAEVYYERSLRISETLNQDRQLAMTLSLLAAMYVVDGRYAQAEGLLRRAVTSLQLAAGHDSPEAAVAMVSLGSAVGAQQRYAEAIQLQLSGVDILERALGNEDVAVAKALHDLAETYRGAARFDDAEPLYRRSLDIIRKKLGPEHPDVTTCLLHYGLLLKAKGRKREAGKLLKEARQRMDGEEDPSRFVVDVRDLPRSQARGSGN
jgi:tetratricopeptide (TPR) repeat protein